MSIGATVIVVPFQYAMLWNNDAYYIVGFHDLRCVVTKFRVDRISDFEVTDTDIVRKPNDFDV